jgi:hypothetical protein
MPRRLASMDGIHEQRHNKNMEEPFDPYLRWLAIRDPKRPPNHYRMLGIDLFESDAEVIKNAADRQMTHVRSFQSGKHSADSQRILNELAAAKICLLSPEKKAAYDAVLRGEVRPTLRVTTPPPVNPSRDSAAPPRVGLSLIAPIAPPVVTAPRAAAAADVAIPSVPFSSLGLGATGSASALPQPPAGNTSQKADGRRITYSVRFVLVVSVAIIAIALGLLVIGRNANRAKSENPPAATAETLTIAPPSK